MSLLNVVCYTGLNPSRNIRMLEEMRLEIKFYDSIFSCVNSVLVTFLSLSLLLIVSANEFSVFNMFWHVSCVHTEIILSLLRKCRVLMEN